MKKNILVLFLGLLSYTLYGQTAKELIAQVVQATGGKENFYKQKNVTYDISYKTPPGPNAITFIGHETYIFNGERSHGKYTTQTITGASEEGFNGEDVWVKIDDLFSQSEQALGVARFLRKTNFYWFSMFFKLLDDGLQYEKLTDQKVNDKNYHRVKMTFAAGVGDTQDTYVLYINKKTKLIDQFLFTITGFGITQPNLMSFDKWETINGIKIPTVRKYIAADWEGKLQERNLPEQIGPTSSSIPLLLRNYLINKRTLRQDFKKASLKRRGLFALAYDSFEQSINSIILDVFFGKALQHQIRYKK